LLLPSTDAVPGVAQAARKRTATAWIVFALVLLGLLGVIALRLPFIRLAAAILVTLAFAVLARSLGGVTATGAAAGFLVTALLLLSSGWAMFFAVLLVFALTLAATRFGRRRKQRLTIAEPAGGRDGTQVLANVGIAAMAAALSALTPYHLPLLAGSFAALAEAACDTVSSEAGKALAFQARLITSGRAVPAGTDGAVSAPGTLLGAMAATLVAVEGGVTGLLDPGRAAIVAAAGILGMLLDSLLGATLERRGWLSNNTVNLTSTFAAALLATIVAW
jgi:uncharacterized protein (TIGR00297 family)